MTEQKQKHMGIALILAMLSWFIFSFPIHEMIESGKNINGLTSFIYENIKEPVFMLILVSGFLYDTDILNKKMTPGMTIGSIFTILLSLILIEAMQFHFGTIGRILSVLSGFGFGFFPGYIIGTRIFYKEEKDKLL